MFEYPDFKIIRIIPSHKIRVNYFSLIIALCFIVVLYKIGNNIVTYPLSFILIVISTYQHYIVIDQNKELVIQSYNILGVEYENNTYRFMDCLIIAVEKSLGRNAGYWRYDLQMVFGKKRLFCGRHTKRERVLNLFSQIKIVIPESYNVQYSVDEETDDLLLKF